MSPRAGSGSRRTGKRFGLDGSMIMAYGQDDRICAFTSLMAFLDAENSQRTNVCLFVDKEEIGSVGATGMQSRFWKIPWQKC